ncbi:two-component system, chemotaxis family, response regulator CheY [Selenomonas sp. WCT3]|uniref:response regulator n=1 Tax=Selenomonas sp. WCT3 TaxID=3158785 RepID=UPI000890832C|nr:two-component system, chemotaxis family, response regulator CheY [Selenomonas ruminantium]
MKILIAEDDRLSRIFLKKFLGNYGECDVAVDGMEALDLFMDAIKDKQPYELLCLDIMMPRIDGLKLLKAIRVLEKQHQLQHTYIIMMTALADVEYVDQALELGCDAYAAKPIDTDKVTLVMKNLGLIKE